MKRLALGVLVLITVGGAVLIVMGPLDLGSRGGGVLKEEEIPRMSAQRIRSLSEVETRSERDFAGRREVVHEWKKRWLALVLRVGPYDPGIEKSEEVRSLAEKTVSSLSLSRELMDLSKSFKDDDLLQNYRWVIIDEVCDKLKDPAHAAEFRRRLMSLYQDEEMHLAYSAEAGAGCSEDEIAVFLDEIEAIGNARSSDLGRNLRVTALLGYAYELSREDPLKAVSFVTDEMSKGFLTDKSVDLNIWMLAQRLRDDMDFMAFQRGTLEPAMEASNHRGDVFDATAEVRNPLFRLQQAFAARWAGVSFDEAAAYYWERRDVYPPVILKSIAFAALDRDEVEGMKWVHELPEGPHRKYVLEAIENRRSPYSSSVMEIELKISFSDSDLEKRPEGESEVIDPEE